MTPLILGTEQEYLDYFIENFTRAPLWFQASTGRIPVYFSRNDFAHAFYESNRNGVKDTFSRHRASHMSFISSALQDTSLLRKAGWDSKRKTYDHTRCVAICVDDFVIVVRFSLNTRGYPKGRFVTCYVADNSIGKIRQAPPWSETACLQEIKSKMA